MDNINKLFQDNYTTVFNFIFTLTKNTADAEDITQNAFTNIFLHIDSYDTARPFIPWATHVAYNCFINFKRQEKRETDGTKRVLFSLDSSQSINRDFDDRADSLSFKDKYLYNLKYISGFKVREISEIVQMPQGTVMWRLHNIKRRLKNI